MDEMIRARMRLVGRFLVAMRERDSTVSSLQSVLYLIKMYDIISTIEQIGKVDEMGMSYIGSSSAFNLTTYLKEITTLFNLECVKKGDKARAEESDSLLKLFRIEFGSIINPTVKESQSQMNRRKKHQIPKTDSINRFLNFLNNNINKSILNLKSKFTYLSWKN